MRFKVMKKKSLVLSDYDTMNERIIYSKRVLQKVILKKELIIVLSF